MSAETTLRLLFPIELEGDHLADLQHDALHLDTAKKRGEDLLGEMFADKTTGLLRDWETALGLTPGTDDPLQLRRNMLVRKLRERGGLSIPYFMMLAEALGYEIEIIEPVPFMAGWAAAGGELFSADVIYQWGVKIFNQPVYKFRVGESTAGERLAWWNSQSLLEDLFTELKPAHTYVYFSYID